MAEEIHRAETSERLSRRRAAKERLGILFVAISFALRGTAAAPLLADYRRRLPGTTSPRARRAAYHRAFLRFVRDHRLEAQWKDMVAEIQGAMKAARRRGDDGLWNVVRFLSEITEPVTR